MIKDGNQLVKDKPLGKWQFLGESNSLAPSRTSPFPTAKHGGTGEDSPASQPRDAPRSPMWRSHSTDVSLMVKPQVRRRAGWSTCRTMRLSFGLSLWDVEGGLAGGAQVKVGLGRVFGLPLLPPQLTGGELEE